MKTLLLIDGHAMIHRAFHALPDTFKSSKGIPTNAVYGFFMMLQKIIIDFKPTHLAVCFDTPKPTFRKELFNEYQSKRPPMDDTLKVQIPEIKTLLTKGGIQCLEMPGFEADDVIGTLAEQYKAKAERVLIVTGDRDLLQLADTNVFVITPIKGVSQFILYTPEEVVKKFGVTPLQIPDYKALAGDASDNYNTAKGIGPKTAQKILSKFKTIENLLSNLPLVDNLKWKETLEANKESITLFKNIATIVRDVDITASEEKLLFKQFDDSIKDDLRRLELYSLMSKLFNEVKEEKPVIKPEKKKEEKPKDQIDLFS